jgi:hypothetical protein
MSFIIKEYIKNDTCNQKRTYVDFKCDFCNKAHSKEKRFLNKKNFCSVKCFNKFRYKDYAKFTTKCLMCATLIVRNYSQKNRSKSGIYFCSKKCKDEGQKLKNNIKNIWPSHYGSGNGQRSYRKRALASLKNECNHCGYKKIKDILQVHHIDHNRSNNDILNLKILCPNCHAIEHLNKKN